MPGPMPPSILTGKLLQTSVSISMPEKPIAELPKRWTTGRLGWAAAMPCRDQPPSCRSCRRWGRNGHWRHSTAWGRYPSSRRPRRWGSRFRHPGGDIAHSAEVIGRRLVIVDLRPDLRRVLLRLLRDHLAPRGVLRIEPLAAGERSV